MISKACIPGSDLNIPELITDYAVDISVDEEEKKWLYVLP
jgi:hypothetical protein